MINYTLTIPTNKKVGKNNSNVVGSVDYKSIALPAELQGLGRCIIKNLIISTKIGSL